ncbi:hypothetical protein [Orgyia leucostigma nucleopolyhedrovirus]|uniref:Uncharacterized protein n=1 Tax=Orgyia leucostigma nucleopolyhedrovirus TaxID=490711 RepID=B0FDW4_9ABAC|nr:hypothetical protein [Orgyia leucostigma nucleopolyhedrovirus]ABY65822.1 hypothetical protein [Orgyia leucostigma nucleopolyhedrovirus]
MSNQLSLVFVWYHRDEFVFNTHKFPFWHNIQYHSQHYRCYVLYYIEDLTTDLVFDPTWPKATNVHLVNFKTASKYSHNLMTIKHKECRIDYMKLQLILDPSILAHERLLLMMDMDCTITNVDWKCVRESPRYLEPFFDKTVSSLYASHSMIYGAFESYIENYAVLLNRNKYFFTGNLNLKINLNDDHNNVMYAYYVAVVRYYYKTIFKFVFPNKFENMRFKNSVNLEFRRGNSYNVGPTRLYDYVYNPRQKPVFEDTNLCIQLFTKIINRDFQEIDKLITRLRELNYDFQSKFEWSNSKQHYTNVAGVLLDRLITYNFTGKSFLLPIVKHD